MGTLVDFEIKKLPGLLLVGKEIRYNMETHMRGDNRLGPFWDKCFAENAFAPLEAQGELVFDPSYVGVMIDWDKGDGDFSYIIGMLMNEGATVPDGYYSKALDAAECAVGYIRGAGIEDVCASAHAATEQKLRETGRTCDHMRWCMELYNCPRFTTPDDDGNIILDYYIPLD